MPSMN